MKRSHIIIAALVLAAVAGSTVLLRGKSTEAKTSPYPARHGECQYNICLLLDLSDRIDPARDPLQAERDRRVIADAVTGFGELVKRKLYVNSRDSFRVVVAPQPNDYRKTLLEGSDRLAIDLRELKVSEKRTRLPEMKERLLVQAGSLYGAAVQNSGFAGGDIWSFFRDDLESYRVTAEGRSVRNILVVLTDGYITFDSVRGRPREGGLTSWMEIARLRHGDWQKRLKRGEAGLLPAGTDHGAWEVLVLEVAPHTPRDMPVLRGVWGKWLADMGVRHFRMEQRSDTGLPAKETIAAFLREGLPATGAPK